MKKIYFLLSLITTLSMSAQVSITYRVDITDYLAGGSAPLDATGIRIAGNFGTNMATTAGVSMVDWSPTDAGSAMTDLGNNLWEITIDYPSSGDTVYFKFVNGDWGADESVSDTVCGGGGGFGTDRIFAIPASNTGLTFCWASCTQCDGSAANIIESNINNVSVSPNPSQNYTIFNFNVKNSNETNISIYDITGKLVDNVINSVLNSGLQSVEYNTSHLNNGIYIYKISSENEDITGKLIIK
jgi:hypothetical protein